MNDHLTDFAEKRNWNEFRDAYVLHPKVAEILVDNMMYLRRIYFKNTKNNDHIANHRDDDVRVCVCVFFFVFSGFSVFFFGFSIYWFFLVLL